MKILQVTHYGTTTNYGTVLQAFSLQKALESLGHEAILLKSDFSYYNKISKWYREPHIALKAWFQKRKITRAERLHPRHFFNFIQSNMTTTKRVYHTIRELRKEPWDQFDAMITGSDQVWSDNEPKPLYFLQFGPEYIRRISYAASIGTKPRTYSSYIQSFQKAIQKFAMISVREYEALDLCKAAKVPAVLIPDPVMLFSEEDYVKFLHLPPKQAKTKTCLIYFVSRNGLFPTGEIFEYCAENHLTPVMVCSQRHTPDCYDKDFICYPDIPTWLQYIRNADLVVTDSFHGTLFSILFGKKFVIFPKGNFDSRFNMLDRCFGIGPAICRGSFRKALEFQMDHEAIRRKLPSIRDMGFQFLAQALSFGK